MAEPRRGEGTDVTAGLPRRNRRLPAAGSARGGIAGRAIAWGLWCGVLGGGVAGTMLVPLWGTAYGAAYGFAISVVPSIFGAAAILAGTGPTRSKDAYVRRVRTVTIGLGVAAVAVGIPVARTIDDGFGGRSSSWFTTAVAIGLLAVLGVLVWATRSLAALDPPRPAGAGVFGWAVFALSGGAIAVVVGVLIWSHLLTGGAQQRNDAIALRNRAGDALGLTRYPESSRRVETSDAPVEGCPAGPISTASQATGWRMDPTELLDRAAAEFSGGDWGIVRGESFVRGWRWMYAEQRDRSVLVQHVQGNNEIYITAVVGCPQGVPSGSLHPVPGGPAPLGETVRTSATEPIHVPAGEEIAGRDVRPAIVSAAWVPEERMENRGEDQCSPRDYAQGPDAPPAAEPGDDRIVVVVAHEVDELRGADDDWVVVRRSGDVVVPTCTQVERGDGLPYGIGLPSTILLAGPFEDDDDPVDHIELRSALSTVDRNVGDGYEGRSIDQVAAIDDDARPVLAIAQEMPGVDPEGPNPGCPDAAQTVWVIWDREVILDYQDADESAGYQVTVEGEDEPIASAFHPGTGEAHALCVDTDAAVVSITFDRGAVADIDRAITVELDDLAS